jgi:hypothetical protein
VYPVTTVVPSQGFDEVLLLLLLLLLLLEKMNCNIMLSFVDDGCWCRKFGGWLCLYLPVAWSLFVCLFVCFRFERPLLLSVCVCIFSRIDQNDPDLLLSFITYISLLQMNAFSFLPGLTKLCICRFFLINNRCVRQSNSKYICSVVMLMDIPRPSVVDGGSDEWYYQISSYVEYLKSQLWLYPISW